MDFTSKSLLGGSWVVVTGVSSPLIWVLITISYPIVVTGVSSPLIWVLITISYPWVVISRVIDRVTILITRIKGLITPLTTTHEPPHGLSDSLSNKLGLGCTV